MSINLLDEIEKKTKKGSIHPDMWREWEQHQATKYFKTFLQEELLDALSKLISGSERDQFYRGVIDTLDLTINYKPENLDD